MSGSDGSAVPVPPEPGETFGPGAASTVTQLPWQSIPKFTPGVTSVQEYSRKLRFLASMWPPEHLHLLAPRAALLVEGSAFTLVSRLDGTKLRVNSQDGVALLVKTIGGQWGSTELEERYEHFEKALYSTTQKHDESNDSFISRLEGHFAELFARSTKLEEVQAYVLLRQSTLPSEDKKRILMEHAGALSYEPVVRSLRLIGSKFFHEFQTGGKSTAKTKVYDSLVTEETEILSEPAGSERAAFVTYVDDDQELDPETVEIYAAQEDPDACLIQSFEAEFEDYLQETPEMSSALLSYVEARQRLADRRKTRGFWPPSSKGGGKKSFKGGKGKGKRSGKGNLLSRIARSTCRICHAPGHWKAECPQRFNAPAENGGAPTSAAAANMATSMDANLDEKEIYLDSDLADESFTILADDAEVGRVQVEECFTVATCKSRTSQGMFRFNNVENRVKLSQRMHRFVNQHASQQISKPWKTSNSPTAHVGIHQETKNVEYVPTEYAPAVPRMPAVVHMPDMPALNVSDDRSTFAILDTGASRCIIGTSILQPLVKRLPINIRRCLKEKPSQVRFRFGNNQTLTSQKRVHFPLSSNQHERVWLGVEVVEGSTPFLFSKRAFKQLGGILDSNTDQCTLRRLQKTIDLETNATGLYVMDILDLCTGQPIHSTDRDSFVGHTCHVGDMTCQGVEQNNIPSVNVDKSPSDCGQINSSEINSSDMMKDQPKPKMFSPPFKTNRFADVAMKFNAQSSGSRSSPDVPKSSQRDCPPNHGDSCSDDQHVEGCSQHHHGHSHTGSAVVSEHARDRRPKFRRPCGSGTIPKAGNHVPGDATSTHSPSGSGGIAEDRPQCQSLGDHAATTSSDVPKFGRSSSRPRRRFLLHGEQCQTNRFKGQSGRKSGSSSLAGGWDIIDCKDVKHRGRSRQPRSAGPNDTSTFDLGSMGTEAHHLGQEASRKDLLPDLARRSAIPGLVPSEIFLTDSRTERLCGVQLCSAGTRCRERSPRPSLSASISVKTDVSQALTVSQIDPMIAHELEDCQLTCARFEPHIHAQKYQTQIDDALNVAIKIADQVTADNHSPNVKSNCFLLEIYAGEHSPLTESVLSLGLLAVRFTRKDGDLSTFAGRKKLWSWIDELQPTHILVAPECGPWGGWNRLNAQKSPRLWTMIHDKQENEKIHVQLCSKICEYQTRRNRHFHLEQPAGSAMINTKEFDSIRKLTHRAMFDMCSFGLKIPKTNKFLKKRSQVWTSSEHVWKFLNRHDCKQNHDHQTIEGSVSIDGRTTRLSQFCATYCRGFTTALARVLQECPMTPHVAFALEDETPAKRARLDPRSHKRLKTDPKQGDVEVPVPSTADCVPAVVPTDSLWYEAFKMANRLAPRVGNQKHVPGSDIVELVQGMLSNDFQIQSLFICRGTDRLQVPIGAPTSKESPWRHTLCVHRQTGQVHDLGCHRWHTLTRAMRIAKTIPSKLTITMFGQFPIVDESHTHQPLPNEPPHDMSNAQDSNPPQSSALRVRAAVSSREVVKLPDVCEGWAPPPTPLHGPAFRSLTSQEKSHLIQLHKNLGHPDPSKLAMHLQAQKAPDHIVKAAREYVCDSCVESQKPLHQRPAKLQQPMEFNDLVGIDGLYWTGKGKFQCYLIHIYDEATGFHLAKRIEGRNTDHFIPALQDLWYVWAGNPKGVYLDPAGEFRSDVWLNHLQTMNTHIHMTTEAWQRGKVERHGSILKDMLHRMDNDKPFATIDQFDEALRMCCQAKNALTKKHGYSPEQIVLGKATHLPASLASDDASGAHLMSLGDSLESSRFKELLERRTQARQAFILSENAEAIRRAFLRRSCPVRGPYHPGQLVLYWLKRNRPNRSEGGRWYGPAKVIIQEGSSIVWVSHADRLLRCAPENLRPASLREWTQQDITNKDPPFEIHDNLGSIPEPAINPEIPEDHTYSPTTPANTIPASPPESDQPEGEVSPPMSENNLDEVPTESCDTDQEPHDEPIAETEENTADASVVLQTLPIPEMALHVSEETFIPSEPLFVTDTLIKTEENPQICLAEDGLPYHDAPMECLEEECFCLEIPMKPSDLDAWYHETNPEEMCHVAAASQRARAEVQVKTLTPAERKLFDVAKDNELSCWISTNSLKPILRQKLNPDQILRSRWVLTWKDVEADENKPAHRKAKARLVVLGYMDPKITSVARDSPTLTREGRNIILQCVAAYRWELTSFDIKTAFLRGKADEANPLAMEPPKELRDKLKLSDQEVCSLVGNAYGRVDAPLLFYKELSRHLHDLGFKTHPLEPCMFILETGTGNSRKLHGIVGTHVDDGVGGGDEYFHKQLKALEQKLPFGSLKYRKFTFTGVQLEQHPDFSISASQQDYIHRILAIDVGKARRENPQSPATESEKSRLRGLVGSLQYAVTHSRPDIASKLGEVQAQMSQPTVQSLLQCNKVLREAQEFSDVKIWFRHMPPEEITFVSFGDASFASPKQLSSFQGSVICATTEALNANQEAPISPISWSSKKISRVVRSTLSAEAYSMSRSIDRLGWLRLLWGIIVVPQFPWKEPQKAYSILRPAVITTDCRSLFDLVSRTAMPSCEEYRTTLEVLLIREQCKEHCLFRWIPTTLMLADPLTKPMDASFLRAVLSKGIFCLYDEASCLRYNAQRKDAISWLNSKQSAVDS